VPYVAGYLTRLYAKLKNSGSGLWKKTCLVVPVHSLDPTASLAPIFSRLYKSKAKPFAWSIFTRIGIWVVMVFIRCYWSLDTDLIE
jgi:hypothetical protein